MSSADSFNHTDDIHSKTHHRLEVYPEEDSQHGANNSNGRHFIKKLSQGLSFLQDAMNTSTNLSNAKRSDFHHQGNIHSKTQDRLVSSYAGGFVHENNYSDDYSDDRRFFNNLSQG